MKVSPRSPELFFLIKLIRQSAMGAGLAAARDRALTPTCRLSSGKIAAQCGPLGGLRRFKALGKLHVSQLLLSKQLFQFNIFFFSFPVAFEPSVLGCSS